MSRKFTINGDHLKVFETVPDLYPILSPDLHILTASDAYLKATFTVREEIVGKHLFDVFPENPDTPQANGVSNLEASLKEVLATGKPHQMALQRYDIPGPETKGGFEEKYWQPINTPVLDEQKNVLYIIHKVSDVSQQIKNQQHIRDLTLREKEALQVARLKAERYEELMLTLFKEAPVPIVILDGEQMMYQLVNPAFQKLFPGREILGKPLLEAYPEFEDSPIPAILEKVYRTGETFEAREMPLMMARYEGDPLEQIYWTFTYQARRNKQGDIDGVIAYTYEVTEQIEARKRIEESESRFRHMVEQAPGPITLTRGLEVVIEQINTSMLRVMGKTSREEVIGKKMIEVLPEVESQSILKIAVKVFETGESFRGNEVPVRLQDGENLEQHFFNISYTPLIEEGKVTGVMHVAIDVTEQVVARRKIEEGQEELKRFKFMADRARDLFILMREDGSFAYLNKKALEAWGYTEGEALQLRFPDADPVYQQEAFSQLFAKAQKETIPQFETLHKRKGGHIFP